MAKLGDVFTLIRNGASIKQTEGAGGFPITRIETIANRKVDHKKFGYADIVDITKYESYVLQDGDILMSHINSEKHLGKVALYKKQANEQIIHGMNLLLLRANPKILLPAYAAYYFETPAFLWQVQRITKKSVNQASFTVTALKEVEIPLPSLDTQRRIAAILDKVTDLIAQRRAQLDKLDLLVKSRFVEMFGDPVLNPNRYKIQSLQSLIDEGIITYHLDGNHGSDYPRSEEFVDSGVPYIGANCIKNGIIDFSLAKCLTQERAAKLRKGIAQNGDVLFAHNATVGPVVVLETDEPKIILSTSLTAYRCNRKVILSNYLKAYMLSDGFIRQYSEEMKQTTRNQVPITAQRKYLFMVPPIAQQKEFDSFVAYTDKAKAQIEISLDKIEILKNSLMQKYFE